MQFASAKQIGKIIKINEKEFLNKYIHLLGKKVSDELFETKRLTKTALMNKYISLFIANAMASAYDYAKDSYDYAEVTALLEKIIETSEDVLKMPKNKALFYNDYVLPFSLGNSKIGKDTLCISLNTGMLCYMALLGKCSNCGICYANASNKMYHNEFKKNCLSQLHFLKFHCQDLIKGTIKAIYEDLTKKEIENIKFLRFNINGDLLNQGQLLEADAIAKALIDEFGLFSAYSYTHNQELDLSEAENIVFNCSDFFASECNKTCLTIFSFNPFEYNEEDTVLCNGNCFNCPYCKSKFENRTVLFLAHGGKYKGVKALNPYMLQYLENKKAEDYLLFMRQLAMV